ncbi:MAG: zinc ribbon domain-containing protein [Anaerolineae bacterium]|nr:zinc ribbon domain-containing protein [Anaerolineae bacterium]
MSIGSILVGVAFALVVGAYLARPFRRGRVDLDRAIETWVSQIRMGEGGEIPAEGAAEEAANHCSQCGHRVGPDDRFCAGCGKPLPGSER